MKSEETIEEKEVAAFQPEERSETPAAPAAPTWDAPARPRLLDKVLSAATGQLPKDPAERAARDAARDAAAEVFKQIARAARAAALAEKAAERASSEAARVAVTAAKAAAAAREAAQAAHAAQAALATKVAADKAAEAAAAEAARIAVERAAERAAEQVADRSVKESIAAEVARAVRLAAVKAAEAAAAEAAAKAARAAARTAAERVGERVAAEFVGAAAVEAAQREAEVAAEAAAIEAAEEAAIQAATKAAEEAATKAAEEAAQEAEKEAAVRAVRESRAKRIAEADRIARASRAAKAARAARAARAEKFAQRDMERAERVGAPIAKPIKRINAKLAIALPVVAASLIVGVMLLHGWQVKSTANGMKKRAETAYQEGKMAAAERFYTYYVHYRPEDAKAYSKLALLVADGAKMSGSNPRSQRRAFFMLEQATRQDPEDLDVRSRLVDFSMKIHRMTDAQDHLKKLIAAFPEKYDLRVKLGKCQVATEHFREAIISFQEVVGRDQSNIEAYVELANLFHDRLDDAEQANAMMMQMVTANSGSAKAYLERGRFRRKIEELEDAQKDINRALEISPEDVDVLVAAGQVSVDKEDYDTAREYLDRARDLHPDNEMVHQQLAVLNVTVGRTADAIEGLQKAMEKGSEDPHTMLSLADLQLKKGNLDAVRQTVKKMEQAGYRPEILKYFEARIQAAEGQWRDASIALQQLRTKVAGWPEFRTQVDLFLGACYEQLRLTDRQMDMYQQVLNDDATSVPARLGYASALFRNGKLDQASAEYEKLRKKIGDEDFLKLFAVRNDLFQLILTRIERLPEHERDWTELEKFIDELDKVEGIEKAQKTLMRAELLAKKGDPKKARQLVAAASRAEPKQLTLWLALAKLAAMDEGAEAGLKVLEDAVKQVGDSLAVRLTRADLAVRLEAAEAKNVLATLATNTKNLSKAEKARLWRGLGVAYYRLRDRQKAKHYWELVSDARPKDVRNLLTLFELARESGKEAEVKKATENVVEQLGPRSSESYYCQASELVWRVHKELDDKRSLTRAKQLLKNAAETRPSWHEVARLEGEIALLENNQEEAIAALGRAAELGPVSPVYLGQLVRLLYIHGRYDEARDVMARLGQREVSLTMRKLEAELSYRLGDFDQALELAEKAVTDSRNPTDFLWYGQLLARAGKFVEAEAALRKTLELDAMVSEAWPTLVALLVQNKKEDEARQLTMKAQVTLPEDRTPLVLAQCYQVLGDLGLAEQHYLSAVSYDPENLSVIRSVARFYLATGRGRQARQFLDQILKLTGRDPEKYQEQLVWARRSLARVLAAEGTWRQLQEAMKLLDRNAGDGKIGLEDLRLKAAILASRSERRSQTEAIDLFKEIRDERNEKLTPQEQFQLARLYEKTNSWTQCLDEMRQLLNREPENVGYLSAYIEMLLRRDRPTNAILPWFAKLEKLAPNTAATTVVNARLLVKNGETDKAVAMLKGLIPRPLPDKQLGQLRQVAQLLEDLKQIEAAKEMLAELAERAPAGNLVLADFLGRHQTLEDALNQCQVALDEDVPVTAVIPVISGILHSHRGKINAGQFDRVRSWFDRALEEAPNAKNIQLQLAGFHDLQDNHAEAVAVYRNFLKRPDVTDREKAIVGNNLAFFLAAGEKKGKEALEMIDESIEILGPSPELLDTRAMAHLALGKPKEAINDLREAIKDSPSGIMNFHLALAHEAAGDKNSASRALKVAQENYQLSYEEVPKIERASYQRLIGSLATAKSKEK